MSGRCLCLCTRSELKVTEKAFWLDLQEVSRGNRVHFPQAVQSKRLQNGSKELKASQASQVSQNGAPSDWASLNQLNSWGRDPPAPDWGSGHSPPQQLYHRSKSVPLIPNRLRVFAGTSNSVRLLWLEGWAGIARICIHPLLGGLLQHNVEHANRESPSQMSLQSLLVDADRQGSPWSS